jgi:hypothetical protein
MTPATFARLLVAVNGADVGQRCRARQDLQHSTTFGSHAAHQCPARRRAKLAFARGRQVKPPRATSERHQGDTPGRHTRATLLGVTPPAGRQCEIHGMACKAGTPLGLSANSDGHNLALDRTNGLSAWRLPAPAMFVSKRTRRGVSPWCLAVVSGRGFWPRFLAAVSGRGFWPWFLAVVSGRGFWPWCLEGRFLAKGPTATATGDQRPPSPMPSAPL